MGHYRPLFLYFRLFNAVARKQMFNVNFADDWIRTPDLWYWKQWHYQYSSHHFHILILTTPEHFMNRVSK